MTDLTVPEVLRRAEQVIGERGLHRGDFSNDDGPALGAVCAWGAINVVVFETPWVARSGGPQPEDRYVVAALAALADYLDLSTHPLSVHGAISDWNDDESHTEDDVRAALLAAADRAEREVDLHADLHPQSGETPAAPLPAGVEGFRPGRAS